MGDLAMTYPLRVGVGHTARPTRDNTCPYCEGDWPGYVSSGDHVRPATLDDALNPDLTKIYVMHSPELGISKVGISGRITSRLVSLRRSNALRTGVPDLYCARAFAPNGGQSAAFIESLLHHDLSCLNIRGEWFKALPADVDFAVARLNAGIHKASDKQRKAAMAAVRRMHLTFRTAEMVAEDDAAMNAMFEARNGACPNPTLDAIASRLPHKPDGRAS